MTAALSAFEHVARTAHRYSVEPVVAPATHPFEQREISPDLPPKVRILFDDGHFAEAAFEALKYLDSLVGKAAPGAKAGEARMMAAFNEAAPLISLTPLSTDSERDEQRGYKFLFAGAIIGIRNPRGHEYSVVDSPDLCLDHLSIASALLRRLQRAGVAIRPTTTRS